MTGLVFTLTFFLSSCVLDLEEDTSGVFSIGSLNTQSDIDAALAPAYRSMMEAYRESHRQRCITYGADDLTTWWGGNKEIFRIFDRFDYGNGESSSHPWLQYTWDQYWGTIYFANTVIDGLKSSTADENLVLAAEGEARFLRALAYFHLVRSWGNMPIIVDGVAPTGDEVRATVLENYQLIEQDLLFAEANLPAPQNVTAVGKVSLAGAKTLLADLYLTWGGWPVKDASKYAMAAQKSKDVIDMNYYSLLPFDELWKQENQNSLESIFAVQFSEAEDIRYIGPQNFHFHSAGGWSDAYPERQFFIDFPEGFRKDITFYSEIPQRVGGGGQVTETGETKPWPESQRNHPMYRKFNIAERKDLGNKLFSFRAVEVYRYAEVLLLYAEAQTRASGANAQAIEAFNQVKRRSMGLPYNVPDGSVDVATMTADEIVAEKGWELAGEYKRWFDLVRTEKVQEVTLRRDPTEEIALVRQPTEANYIAPIPQETINTSKIKQNPEGFKIQ